MHKSVIYKVEEMHFVTCWKLFLLWVENNLHKHFSFQSDLTRQTVDLQSFPGSKMMEMSVVCNSEMDIF